MSKYSCVECGVTLTEVDIGWFECHNPNCHEYLKGEKLEVINR